MTQIVLHTHIHMFEAFFSHNFLLFVILTVPTLSPVSGSHTWKDTKDSNKNSVHSLSNGPSR